MRRSARRDQSTGTVDKIAGRVLETIGKLTGRTSHKAKGKAARGRGRLRTTGGTAKRRAR